MKTIQAFRLSVGENVVKVAGTAEVMAVGADDGGALVVWLLVNDDLGLHRVMDPAFPESREYFLHVCGEFMKPIPFLWYVGTAKAWIDRPGGATVPLVWHVFASPKLSRVQNV